MELAQQDTTTPVVSKTFAEASADHSAIARAATPAHPSSNPAGPSPSESAAPAQDAPAGGQEGTVSEALHVAISLAQDGEADEAAAVLSNEVDSAYAGPGMGAAYGAVIEARLRTGDLEGAFGTLAEARSKTGAGQPCAVTAASYESVLRNAVQAQQHGRAVELLRDMCNAGAVPNDATFNHVLDGAVRARAFGEAWDILELLLAQRRKADKYFVSILTKSLESNGDRRWIRRGIGLVDRFIEQQREDVDEIVFNSLLNVLGHVGDMLKLQQTLDKMFTYGVPPSAVTYGTVVKAYGRARDIDAVLKVWHEMRQRCLGVNPVTCGCVLDACVKCGHLDKAMAIFQEMRLQGLHKNTVLYATLIKGLAKVRDLVGAVHLYQEMRMEQVPCNLVTFNSLMDVCVRCGDLQMAAVFLQDMMQLGIEPDLITFSTLIKGYSHMGEVRKALALAEELKSRGLKCDEIMYNSLIDGCSKAHELEEGVKVFQDMLQCNVPPSNITFSILVKLHFEDGRMADAFRLVDEMATTYRCPPSRVVYSVLLRCCAQFGGASLPRGAALLTDLANKRHSKLPDQGMVGTLLSGCVQHGDLETASQLAREFGCGKNRHGNAPLDSLRALFEALAAAGESPRGQELLEYLRKRGLPSAHVTQLRHALSGGGTLHTQCNTSGSAPTQQYDQYGWHQGYGQEWNASADWYGGQEMYHQPPTAQDFYAAAMYMGAPGFPTNAPGSFAPPPYPVPYGAEGAVAMPVPPPMGPNVITPPMTPTAGAPFAAAPAAQVVPPPPPGAAAVPPPVAPSKLPPSAANKENATPPAQNIVTPAGQKGVKVMPPGLTENQPGGLRQIQ